MIRQFRDWLFKPPYSGVPWLVWFYIFGVCMLCTQGGVFTGHLVGIDDPVRMTQVLDWINGHGWYDRTITRANPPEGFTTIWARIVDVPIAAVIVLAQQYTDQKTAALVASVVIPFTELALLFAAARYFARPLVGKQKARLVTLFLMFTTVVNYPYFTISGFHPGEASHRPWYIILNLVLLGAAARIVLGARNASYMMAAASVLLLAVGVEPFPIIAAACGVISFISWWFNWPRVAVQGAHAMMLAVIGSAILLPLHQPLDHLFDISFVEPSLLGPILLGVAAFYLEMECFILKRGWNKAATGTALIILAVNIMIALMAAFPQMLAGPLAGFSSSERLMALNEHYEVRPIFDVVSNKIILIGLLVPILIALISGLIAIRRAASPRRRALYIAYFGFSAFTAATASVYARYINHAMTTTCAWLVWKWGKLKKRWPQNSLATIVLFIMLGPLWLLILPATQGNGPILSEIFLFPTKLQTKHHNCDPLYLSDYLNQHYNKGVLLDVPTWDGSMFLYYSNLKVDFIGLFPSQDKFVDNQNFFVTKTPDQAKDIARRHNLDLVAVCTVPSVINPQVGLDRQILMGLLQINQSPPWLKHVETNLPGHYELYEVDKAALNP